MTEIDFIYSKGKEHSFIFGLTQHDFESLKDHILGKPDDSFGFWNQGMLMVKGKEVSSTKAWGKEGT